MAVFCNLRYDAHMTIRSDSGDTAPPIPVGDAARKGEVSHLVKRLTEKIMDDDREMLRALAGEQVAAAREVMSRRRRALREPAK
jgi:hypothetical protein